MKMAPLSEPSIYRSTRRVVAHLLKKIFRMLKSIQLKFPLIRDTLKKGKASQIASCVKQPAMSIRIRI
jgi:hypothetical protein